MKLKRLTKFILVSLCIALLITNTFILAPGVGAAREADKTETDSTSINYRTDSVEQELALYRAIAIDEAKKEAQAAVEEQLSIIAEEQEKSLEAQNEATEEPDSEDETESNAVYETEAEYNDEYQQSSSSSNDGAEQSDSGSSTVLGSSGGGYLMDIDNPDPNYVGYAIALSDSDRDKVERVVMREMGYCGYTGMALVAQCIRDAFVRSGFTSADDVINTYGYQGSLSLDPSSTCKEVVSYIFDQGGSAVQHRLICYYATNYCTSEWHESQNFVVQYEYSRFFDTVY